MTEPLPEHSPCITGPLLTRRRWLAGAGGVGAVLVAYRGGASSSLLSEDDEDDRDDDGNEDLDGHHGGDDGGEDDDEDEVPASSQVNVPLGATEVRIVNDDPNGFSPSLVTINVGQSVVFSNTHDDAHTATGADFDTGILQPGMSATITFADPGTFRYSCQIHPEMTGTVEVRATGSVASPAAATPSDASPIANAEGEATVMIANLAFDPAELQVAPGATVVWVNQDQLPHTATSNDGAFDTGTLDEGQSGSVRFDQAGRFAYQCSFHPGMTGTVIVA